MIGTQPTAKRDRDKRRISGEAVRVEKLLVEQIAQQAADETRKPLPMKKRPNKRRSRIIEKRSIVLIAAQWIASVVNTGHPHLFARTKRLLSWMAFDSYQAYMLIRAIVGGRIDAQTYAARMTSCRACPSLQKRLVRKRPFIRLYCGSCACPQWRLAELRRHKNWLFKWKCPLNKHEKLGDPPEWKPIIEKEELWMKEVPDEDETVLVDDVVSSGCGGVRRAAEARSLRRGN